MLMMMRDAPANCIYGSILQCNEEARLLQAVYGLSHPCVCGGGGGGGGGGDGGGGGVGCAHACVW